MRFVPDVEAQFLALTERADALGFHLDGTPNPSSCRHYQGMTRVDAADGTPYFLVTRSGNTPPIPSLPDACVCDDSPDETGNGHLVVVRMGSRDPTTANACAAIGCARACILDVTPPRRPDGPSPSSRSSAAIPPTRIRPAVLA